MAGLAPDSLRIVPPSAAMGVPTAGPDIVVEIEEGGADVPDIDEDNNILRINHADGSITVSLDGKPLGSANEGPKKDVDWFDNLADHIDRDELTRITDDLLLGIDEDLESRKEWISDRALGIKLLGLKIELPNAQAAADGAPVEGMSKVRHPLLLEAVIRFQANARGELLPTDGPVKVRNDSTSPSAVDNAVANALEMDFNHYLTTIATEYYPDSDRMFLLTGFGGDGFKKVYKCPLRMRPVSESVDAEDLIVNQSATDLANAQRVTHRSMMRRSVVRRMQLLGIYRSLELPDPMMRQPDELEDEKKSQQGIKSSTTSRPQDREREVYETCCELDIKGFEHKMDGKISGLAVPYVVTIDRSSRETLSVVRNYGKDDKPLPIARERYVKYPFVPGLGFYDIGLLHMLGNATNAVTAAWRLLLDSGMFANFPGFLQAEDGARQTTNIFRVPPGGAAKIKTNGQAIRDSVMPLPYSTQQAPALMQLVENMVETGRRVGGTADVEVGEGRADVPVGTVMAMIDQAIKVMSGVHKRMHSAQAKEFQLLKQLFREDPESFWARGCKSKTQWDKEKLIAALDNCNLVPQADPNTASRGQRLMMVMALKQLQKESPTLYDPIKIDTAALSAIGWQDPEAFFVPPAARAQPPPQVIQAQVEMANKSKTADAKTVEAQARVTEAGAKAAEVQAKTDQGAFAPTPTGVAPPPPETALDQMTAQAKMMDAQTRQREVGIKAFEAANENQNRDQDREARDREAAIGLAKEVIHDPADASSAGHRATKIIHEIDKGLGSAQS